MKQQARACDDYPTTPYPGETPEFAYIIRNSHVYALDGDDFEDSRDFDPLIPLLSYGSNACPGRLAQKFSDPDGIVVLPATAYGIERAWSCNINSNDAVPATLIDAPNAGLACHLLLLPTRLGEQMDRTEGRSGPYYDLCRLTSVTMQLGTGAKWEYPLSYLGKERRGPLTLRGKTVGPTLYTETQARSIIESGEGQCDDTALPPHASASLERSLSEFGIVRSELYSMLGIAGAGTS